MVSLWKDIFQPICGDSVQPKLLDVNGGGTNHIGFEVPDLKKAGAIMAQKGVPVAFHIKDGATYYDTGAVGNELNKLFQRPNRVDLDLAK